MAIQFNLTNTSTGELLHIVFPVCNPLDMTPTGDNDYLIYKDALATFFDTDYFTIFRYDNVFQHDPTWDEPSAVLYGDLTKNKLVSADIPDFKYNLSILAEGMWKTDSGKILEVSGRGNRATIHYPDGTRRDFGGVGGASAYTWLDLDNTHDCFIPCITDVERFLRSGTENIDLNEGAGWGEIKFQRFPSIPDNTIYLFKYGEQSPSDKNLLLFWNLFHDEAYSEPTPDTDPYSNGGYSNGGVGGGGTWYDIDDNIPIPPLPAINASDTGMITIFNPTNAQLNSLSSYLWSSDFEDIISKMWADPFDVMLGLSIVGCTVPSNTTKEVKVGGRSTGVNMNVADSQFIAVDCGTITLDEYYGSYMDYSPYTDISIYLPYIGEQHLDVDIIMGKSIGVVYHIDLANGACVCYITVNGSVKYQYNGNLASVIPFTSANFSQMISGAMGLVSDTFNVLRGNIGQGVSGALNSIESAKPSIKSAGNVSSTSGLLSVRTPYLIIKRPNLCIPQGQNAIEGYPVYATYTLSELKGLTFIHELVANTLTCTEEEQNAIIARLKNGVIL